MKRSFRLGFFQTAAIVLFCLVLITTHFTSGFMARYTTKSSGTDRARVAAFAVEAELDPDPEEDSSYYISIHNNGETAVSCSVQISLKAQQFGMIRTVTLNGVTKSFDSTGTVTFEKLCALQPGESGDALPLRLTVDPAKLSAVANQPDFSNSAVAEERTEAPFELRVIYTQIN